MEAGLQNRVCTFVWELILFEGLLSLKMCGLMEEGRIAE